MESVKEKQNRAFEAMKTQFGYTNPWQAPRLEKVVISSGTGSAKESGRNDFIIDRLSKITGQRPALRGARKSIAGFKIREGNAIGVMVTLRGRRMHRFLDKFLNVALPRTKDFRGLSSKGVDEMGNYTVGVPEHTVFPETSDEELRNVFGMSVTFVTTAETQAEARAFLAHIGVPFADLESADRTQAATTETL